jgi:hypothetical protein
MASCEEIEMTVFVTLRDGHEPLLIAIEAIVSLEGDGGGHTTLVGLINGTNKRIPLPVAIVVQRIEETDHDRGAGADRGAAVGDRRPGTGRRA